MLNNRIDDFDDGDGEEMIEVIVAAPLFSSLAVQGDDNGGENDMKSTVADGDGGGEQEVIDVATLLSSTS